jgi:hypothetical protein
MPLPAAALINEFDPIRSESNEEFIARLKHMGKSNRMNSRAVHVRFYSHLKIPSRNSINSHDDFPCVKVQRTIKTDIQNSLCR